MKKLLLALLLLPSVVFGSDQIGTGPSRIFLGRSAPISPASVSVGTSAVLSGSVLTSSGTVIIVSTTPDAGHDTLSVRAQDNSAVFTVESLTSGTGKVGIGTNSPSEKLHMSSGTLLIDGNTTNSIITSGRVGIGTASPGNPLDVAGSAAIGTAVTGANILTIGGAPTDDSTAYLRFVKSNAVKSWQIAQNHLAVGLEFVPSTTNGGLAFNVPAMVILDGGNVGIGTVSPQTKLHMSSGAFLLDGNQASPQVVIRGVTQAGIKLDRTGNVAATSEPGSIDMRAPNASGTEKQWAYMAARVDDATDATEDSSLYFSSMKAGTLTEAMAIRSGNVGIGNTNPNVALVVTGAGHFTSSMTVAANLLMQNNQDINFKDAGGAERQILSLTSSDIVQVGDIAGGYELDFHSGAKYATLTSNGLWTVPPAAEAIASGGVITANACGGLKRISSASAVTTDTTNTFTAPAAGNAGCCMDVVNVNAADAITLDNNALFKSAGAADVVLGTGDTVRVCSSGASGAWYQIGATGNN